MSPRVLVLALILVPIASDNALAQVTTEGERVSQPVVESAPSAGESRIGWTITERVRYSGLSNQFRPGFSGDDRALVFRTTLQAEFTSRAVTIGGEIQDARAYLTHAQSNVSTALVNPVDLLQAYVRVGGRTTASRLPDVQIGRFTMELGSGRLIAQEARAWVVPAGLRLEIGVTQLIKGPFLRRAPNAPRDEDTTFIYGDLTYAVGAKAGATR